MQQVENLIHNEPTFVTKDLLNYERYLQQLNTNHSPKEN
jgi:hypothetical protein